MDNQNTNLTEYLKEKQISSPTDFPQKFDEVTVDIEKLNKWSKN